MNTTPEQTLNIEYALVSEGNPHASMADYERCARLHCGIHDDVRGNLSILPR
jgi:hypothetical protein